MVAIIRRADRDQVSAVAKRHGVSEQTIYTWRALVALPLPLRGPTTADLEPDGPEEASGRSGVSGAAGPVSRGAPSVSKDDRRNSNRHLEELAAVL
jgi:hypothetical protein